VLSDCSAVLGASVGLVSLALVLVASPEPAGGRNLAVDSEVGCGAERSDSEEVVVSTRSSEEGGNGSKVEKGVPRDRDPGGVASL
jgi:hypothetical protein